MVVGYTRRFQRQPSFTRKDALEEAGITARQESYWRKAGLFTPELGGGRYSEQDIQRLRLIKRLVEVMGVKVSVAQRLIESMSANRRAQSQEWLYARYIDVVRLTFVDPHLTISSLIEEVSRTDDTSVIEKWLLHLAYLRFRQLARTDRSPELYQVRRNLLVKEIMRLDQVARAVYDRDENGERVYMSPTLPEDADLTENWIYHLAQQAEELDISGQIPLPDPATE
jgi:DNA-binding transcriptional MerR regulator